LPRGEQLLALVSDLALEQVQELARLGREDVVGAHRSIVRPVRPVARIAA
jgi:hypothetical protein